MFFLALWPLFLKFVLPVLALYVFLVVWSPLKDLCAHFKWHFKVIWGPLRLVMFVVTAFLKFFLTV